MWTVVSWKDLSRGANNRFATSENVFLDDCPTYLLRMLVLSKMITKLFLCLISLSVVLARDLSTIVWTRGNLTILSVWSNFSFAVRAKGAVWLSNGGVKMQCAGIGWSTFNGSLVQDGLPSLCNGTDARLGPYSCISQRLQANASARAASCYVDATIRYYSLRDAFEFTAEFPPDGMVGTATAPLPGPETAWPQSAWPLATVFPAFASSSDRLGFTTVHGNLLSNNFAWAQSDFASTFVGGIESGPLQLFDTTTAAIPAGQPVSVVMSPITHAKAVFVAPISVCEFVCLCL